MTDLISIMSKLTDNRGNILIPGVQDQVPPPSDEEKWALFPISGKNIINLRC